MIALTGLALTTFLLLNMQPIIGDNYVKFEKVSSSIWDTIVYFFDRDKLNLKALHRVRNGDQLPFGSADGSPVPLFYAAFCGLYDIAEHLITMHPQHVNSMSDPDVTPLVEALMGRQFHFAQLLYQHCRHQHTGRRHQNYAAAYIIHGI
jgi:hypothetical protein